MCGAANCRDLKSLSCLLNYPNRWQSLQTSFERSDKKRHLDKSAALAQTVNFRERAEIVSALNAN